MNDHALGKALIDFVYTHSEFDKTELRSIARQFGHATGSILGVTIGAAIAEKKPYIDEIYIAMIRQLMISSFNHAMDHAIESYKFDHDNR